MKPIKLCYIDAYKIKGMGTYPQFIDLGLRHLQKERPLGSVGEHDSTVTEFILPLDLMRMTVSPALLNEIEEVTLGFKKGQ